MSGLQPDAMGRRARNGAYVWTDSRFRFRLLLVSGLISCASSGAALHLVVLRTVLGQNQGRWVWEVGSEGRIAPFRYTFPASYEGSLLGSTLPSVSPDGRWVAFGEPSGDYDLHLLDVRSGQERRITRLGRRPRRGYTFADVLFDGWSPDSGAFLFTVAHGETTSEWGDLQVPDAAYGSYIYNLKDGTTRCATLPKAFEFVAWLPDGRFLGVIQGQRPQEPDRPVLLRPGDAQGTEVRTPAGYPEQLQASADGKWLTGLLVRSGRERGTAQIVKINVSTMSLVPLVSLNSWTGNERPALSPPDGEHFSYTLQTRMVQRIPEESLFVDGRLVYSCHEPIDYRWVDERSIAVACQDQALVLDSASGKTLGRYSLAPASTGR